MSVTVHLNSDGLIQKYGTNEAKSLSQGGWICQYGPYLSYFVNLELANLTETESIQNDVLFIPKDSLLVSVDLLTTIAAATGVAIDVGLIANDRDTATDLSASTAAADPNGLIAAHPTAEMTVGAYSKFWDSTAIPAAATGEGAMLGEILTVPALITASRTTATAFTAGRVVLRLDVLPNAAIGFGEVH